MSLISLNYCFFLFCCVFLYYALPEKWKNHVMLVASLGFFAYAMPAQLLILMLYAWVIYFLGRLEGKNQATKIGVILSVLLLFFYKYLNFTLSFFTGRPKTFNLIVPIGISYVTFQCIAYLVEISRDKIKAVKNPISFFNYVFCFAKITAGPIEAPAKFFAMLKENKGFDDNKFLRGLFLIAMGFIKKLAIADILAPGVAAVYSAPDMAGGTATFFAVLMYAFQIYFDFSGYTDIARGSAALFGWDFTENFKSPYLATSVVEFWRKWHISLSDWLKNYIYIPLGGSRVGTLKRYRNVFVTFLVSGIWHGASLNFIIWGVLHGFFQIAEMLLKPVMTKLRAAIHLSEDALLHRCLATLRTFVLVAFAWIFFRAETLSGAFAVIKGLFNPWTGISGALSFCLLEAKHLILIAFAAVATVFLQKLSRSFEAEEKRITAVAAVLVCVIAIWFVCAAKVVTAGSDAVSSFIYFDF